MDLRIFVLLLIQLLETTVSAAQASGTTKSITCFSCSTTQPNCRNTCVGNFCYKLQRNEEIERGCTAYADSGTNIGCTVVVPEILGGRGTPETTCICTSDRCNVTSVQVMSIVSIFLITLTIFCL